MATLEDVFGSEFYQKFVEARRTTRFQRFQVTDEMKKQIISKVLEDISPENTVLNYQHQGVTFHVILAETPSSMLNVRELQFGKSVGMLWNGQWISVVMTDEDLNKLEPEQAYILIGYMRERQVGSKVYRNFNCRAVVTMDELLDYKKDKEADKQNTEEAVVE